MRVIATHRTLAAPEATSKALPGRGAVVRGLGPLFAWPAAARVIAAAFWLALGGSIQSFAAQLTATLDRSTIALGETANLSLTFEGGSPARPPAVPAPAQVGISYLGQSSQITILNGQATSTLTHNYRVTPTQTGEYVIPSIQVPIGNRTVASQPLRLTVQRSTPGAVGPGGTVKPAFIKLALPKASVFVGEVFTVEIQLYALNPHDLNMPQLKADGFTLGDMAQPARSRTQIGNTIYEVFTFKVSAVPLRAGTLTLGPPQCQLALRYRKARDPFDPFSDFFGGGIEVRQFTAFGEPEQLEVLPLPEENRPAVFSGAVGNFSMAVSASPTNAAVGDPITVRIQIAGEGALDTVAPPALDGWREFTLYPPTTKVQKTDPLGIGGVKTIEQVVAPQNSEVREIPALSFAFFDPAAKAYRTLGHPAIPLSIRPSAAGQPQPTVLAGGGDPGGEAPARDIVHIKAHLGAVGGFRPLLVQHPWFWFLQAVPVLSWVAVWLWRLRQEQLSKDPSLRRRRQADRAIRKVWGQLPKLAAGNQQQEFFAAIFRLIQERLGAVLDLPASAITEAVVDDQLRDLGVPDEVLAELHDLFSICNEARYAPQQSPQELEALLPRVEFVLRGLRVVKEPKPT